MDTDFFVVSLIKRRSLKDILEAGNYDKINPLVRDGVEKKKLSIQNETMADRRIVILGFDHSVSSQDVQTKARTMRLSRPTHEDAFLFGEQHPNEQRKGPIVFLHSSLYLWSGHFFSLVLDVRQGRRIISLVSTGGSWQSRYRFAFTGKNDSP